MALLQKTRICTEMPASTQERLLVHHDDSECTETTAGVSVQGRLLLNWDDRECTEMPASTLGRLLVHHHDSECTETTAGVSAQGRLLLNWDNRECTEMPASTLGRLLVHHHDSECTALTVVPVHSLSLWCTRSPLTVTLCCSSALERLEQRRVHLLVHWEGY